MHFIDYVFNNTALLLSAGDRFVHLLMPLNKLAEVLIARLIVTRFATKYVVVSSIVGSSGVHQYVLQSGALHIDVSAVCGGRFGAMVCSVGTSSRKFSTSGVGGDKLGLDLGSLTCCQAVGPTCPDSAYHVGGRRTYLC